jgi:hypothetical protein
VEHANQREEDDNHRPIRDRREDNCCPTIQRKAIKTKWPIKESKMISQANQKVEDDNQK